MTREDNIWRDVSSSYEPITYGHLGYIIWELSKNAGVPFSWHDARPYVETALEEIRIHPNSARKIRGRKVRGEESPYSQPAIEQLREKFREAVPILEFTSEKPTITKEMIREEVLKLLEDEKLKQVADKYHLTLEQVKVALRQKKGLLLDLKSRKSRTVTNGGKTQKIVAESELPTLLAQGWRFVATLSSGKVVVEPA